MQTRKSPVPIQVDTGLCCFNSKNGVNKFGNADADAQHNHNATGKGLVQSGEHRANVRLAAMSGEVVIG